MEQIILEVDDTSKKIFNGMSPKSKKKLNQAVSMILKKAANDATYDDYSKLLDDIGGKAVKNGLTPEILEQLLASDD